MKIRSVRAEMFDAHRQDEANGVTARHIQQIDVVRSAKHTFLLTCLYSVKLNSTYMFAVCIFLQQPSKLKPVRTTIIKHLPSNPDATGTPAHICMSSLYCYLPFRFAEQSSVITDSDTCCHEARHFMDSV
jgi:hypothetical protein